MGSITVGADGFLEMHGQNITNNQSALVAGDLTGNDTNDITALDQAAFIATAVGGGIIGEYLPRPPPFMTWWWGITNVTTAPGLLNLGAVAGGAVPSVNVTGRDAGTGVVALPFNTFAAYVYTVRGVCN